MKKDLDFKYDKSLEENVDKYITARLRKNFSGLAIGVIDKGIKVINKGYGLADIKNNIPISTTSSFCIASISKHIFSLAILLLQEQKLLSVNDNITKYFPEFPKKWSEITIHHLLSNQSGIPDLFKILNDNCMPQKGITNNKIIELAIHYELEFIPGSKFRYCNTGFIILAQLIEKISKSTIENYMAKHFFDTFGMENSSIYNERKQHIPNRVIGYNQAGDLFDYDLFTTGCAGIYSSIEDLLIWSRALDKNSIVSQNSFELATTPYIEDYGYGLFINNFNGIKVVGHSGSIVGFRTLFIKFQSTDTTIVILTNGDVSWDIKDLATKIYEFLRSNKLY